MKYILDHDPEGYFTYTPLQLPKGQAILKKYDLAPNQLDTLILIEDGKLYTRSSAVLRISRKLKGLSKLLYPLIVVPRPIRDFLYTLFARYRYKLFGKREQCHLPTEEERSRFLD